MNHLFEIVVGTHFFQVTPRHSDERAKELCYSFVRKFVKVDIQGNNKVVTTFAAANRSRSWFRFHFNALADFNNHLLVNNITKEQVQVTYLPLPEVDKHVIPIKSHWEVRDYQEPIIEYLTKPVGEYDAFSKRWENGASRARLVGIQTGRGKLIRNGTLIKVPLGWKRVEQLTTSDKVMARDGSYVEVLGVFPEKNVQLYRVTFADGRFLDVHGEHLWDYYYINTTPSTRWRTGTTLEMLEKLNMPNPRVYIPLTESAQEPVEFTATIDPYFMGVMLGDGHLDHGYTLTSADPEIVENVKNYLASRGLELNHTHRYNYNLRQIEGRVKNGAKDRIRQDFEDLGLRGKRSWEKFVPKIYLDGTTNQRLGVLQGLLDTDGSVCVVKKLKANGQPASGRIEYCTTSKQLALDVQYLVRSLGGICSIVERTTFYTLRGHKLEGRPSYRVYIRHKRPTELFRLTRKKERLSDLNQYSQDLKLRVRSIVPVNEGDATCIAVNHPDKLFVCEQFIVTHNTFCAIKAISDLGYKPVIIVLAQYVEKWVKDLSKTLDVKPKEILAVQGGAAMRSLTEMAITPGSMDPFQAIVISNRTFDNYLRAYENYGADMDSVGYHVMPNDIWQKLGIGIRLIDEVHMQFHANFRVDLYTHVMQSISLSATLVTRDEPLLRMYKIAYPPNERFHEGEVDKYADSFGVLYRINPRWNVKTSHRGMSSYSHTAFEDSVVHNKEFLNGYAKMVGDYLQQGYIRHYKPGNKAIVFAASVDLCGKMAAKLQERFPDKTVKRYVAEDPYQENYLDPDIRVTTIGSGGTGHDIPGLTDNHMTTAIDSLQANIQAFGRLRKIEDQQTRFYFYSCEQIRKHLGYHEKKRALMAQRAKSYTPLFYGTIGESNWTT